VARAIVAFLLLITATRAFAQDERRVASPNGQLEFRIFVDQPEGGALFRLAYQIYFRGKRLIDTSFLGLNIRDQEPVRGENAGLTAWRVSSEAGRYNSLIAEYMQNGSLGRRINVEVRAANDGIAFRYVIPRSTPLEEILIEDETTEFAFAQDLTEVKSPAGLPFIVQQPGVGWVAISEMKTGDYPSFHLVHADGNIMITRLDSRTSDPHVAYKGRTPLTCPWRVVVVGQDKDHLMNSEILATLHP
jgi:alpha-glucosidase